MLSHNIANPSIKFLFNPLAIFLLSLLVVASLLIRFSLVDFQTSDFYGDFQPWYEHIKSNGGWSALGKQFASYNMPYLYLLTLASYLPLPGLYVVKLIPVIFDYVAAIWIYQLVKQKYSSTIIPWLSFLAVIFAPTVILNGSMWAQCDSIYTSFLLGSLYCMVRLAHTPAANRRNSFWYGGLSLVFFTLAISFKLQAIFFILPILFLLISRRVPWYVFSIIPSLYILLLLPSHLMGTPWVDLLSVPINQINYFNNLTFNAPTAYALIPNAPAAIVYQAGIVLAAAAVIFLAWLMAGAQTKLSPDAVIRIALSSVLIVPYLLPRMHERYFYPADLIAIVFAFYFPRFWFIPVSVLSISLFSYSTYLFGASPFSLGILALVMGLIVIIVARDFFLHHLFNGSSAQ